MDFILTNNPRCFFKTNTFFTGLSDFHKLVLSVFKQARNQRWQGGEVSPALFRKLEKSVLICGKNALIVVICGYNFSFKMKFLRVSRGNESYKKERNTFFSNLNPNNICDNKTIQPFHDGGRYYIETSQWTGFYMITASVMKGLKVQSPIFFLRKEKFQVKSLQQMVMTPQFLTTNRYQKN